MGSNTTNILNKQQNYFVDMPITKQSTARLYIVNSDAFIHEKLKQQSTKQITFRLIIQSQRISTIQSFQNSDTLSYYQSTQISSNSQPISNVSDINNRQITIDLQKSNQYFTITPSNIQIPFICPCLKQKKSGSSFSSLFGDNSGAEHFSQITTEESVKSLIKILELKAHEIRQRARVMLDQLIKRNIINFVIYGPKTTTEKLSDKLESIYLDKWIQVIFACIHNQLFELKQKKKTDIPNINFYFTDWNSISEDIILQKIRQIKEIVYDK